MMLKRLLGMLFNRENLLALLLALALLAILIFISDTSPTWIYQGF
jgi:lipopolysaccharide/colanic/teichoic acid biosynthesis glycosyltransferase